MFSEVVLDCFAEIVSEAHQGEKREALLRMLAQNPEQLAQNIKPHLAEWGAIACCKLLVIVASYSDEEGSREVVEHFKKYFAKELAEMPA